MSGPVAPADANPQVPGAGLACPEPTLELLAGRATEVGGTPVVRVLPKRERRTVGAWCFADHFGPADADRAGMNVGPHPHIGLQTVTWLVEGRVLHRDSLGSEQLIRPGQLNLMTAGRGVSHAEETPPGADGRLHGVQLWVAQPEATRAGDPDFEHHDTLPEAEAGGAVATVLVGGFAGVRSPARTDTPLVGVDLALRGGEATFPLEPGFEYGLVPLAGTWRVDGAGLAPGVLAYLGEGRTELRLDGEPGSRALLLGGEPFAEPVLMWWNFVGRHRDELDAARRDWEGHSGRFGEVDSPLDRLEAPAPYWAT